MLRTSFPDENPYKAIGLVTDIGPPAMDFGIPSIEHLQNLTAKDFEEESLVYPLDLQSVTKAEDVRLILVGDSQKPSDATDSK